MRTDEIIEQIELIVERDLTRKEQYAIEYINDEGWKGVAPVMNEVLGLIIEAKGVKPCK